jgi:hypothetical protein
MNGVTVGSLKAASTAGALGATSTATGVDVGTAGGVSVGIDTTVDETAAESPVNGTPATAGGATGAPQLANAAKAVP